MNRVYSFSGRGKNVKDIEQSPVHVGKSAVVYITIYTDIEVARCYQSG